MVRDPERVKDEQTKVAYSILRTHTALLVSWILAFYVCYGIRLHVTAMLADTQLAYDVERPVRTRSDLAEIPNVAWRFRPSCDIGDWIEITARVVGSYAVYVPLMVAAPCTAMATKRLISMKGSSASIMRFAH